VSTVFPTRPAFRGPGAREGPIFQKRHTHGAPASHVDACASVPTGARATMCSVGHVPTAPAGTQHTTSTAHALYGACATPPARLTAGAPRRRRATPPTGMRAGAASGASIFPRVLRGRKPTTRHDRCHWPGELSITSSTLPPAPQGQARLTHDPELPLLQTPPTPSWGAAVANLEPATSQK